MDDESEQTEGLAEVEQQLPLNPREEIAGLLLEHEGRLGDVYRLTEDGLTPEQIAERLDVATPNFVYTYRYQALAALNGKPTSGSVLRRQTVGALNTLIKNGRGSISAPALKLLQSNKTAVEASADLADPSEEALADDEEKAAAANTLADLEGITGIYAFSYGWYLESLVDSDRGQTLIKVGRAADVAARIKQHTSGARTHMPEPLALIRVYTTGTRDLLEVERTFHDLLETAGHSNPRRSGKGIRQVGREWYLTNEDFLDSMAQALGLRTQYIGRSEFSDD